MSKVRVADEQRMSKVEMSDEQSGFSLMSRVMSKVLRPAMSKVKTDASQRKTRPLLAWFAVGMAGYVTAVGAV